MDPHYAFSIPSVEDDTVLECRIYHPKDLSVVLSDATVRQGTVKGAIMTHPYAPLGGCYDDHVVLAVVETLLGHGYVVGTFNFRGAGGSHGRTTWTGKAELQDYISFAGFLIHYMQRILSGEDAGHSHASTAGNQVSSEEYHSKATRDSQIRLLLGGYSYGSLILARFPPIKDILQRFEAAELGTAGAEIILRARTLAKQTCQAFEEQQSPMSPRGRQLKPESSPTSPSKRVSPMTMGGEETKPSDRRQSRDSRRSVDVIRKSVEVPHRIKAHIKHRRQSHEGTNHTQAVEKPKAPDTQPRAPTVTTSHLLISPVLLPFSSTLLPPGAPTAGFGLRGNDAKTPRQFLQHSSLVIFGSNDAFTSSKRLKHWAERQAKDSRADFQWSEISGAGHFWAEPSVLQDLQQRVVGWIRPAALKPQSPYRANDRD